MPSEEQDATLYQFTPPPPPAEPTREHPAGSARRRRSRVTKAAAGLALVLGAGGGAATVVLATGPSQASLLTATSTTTSPGKTPANAWPGRPFAWRVRGGMFGYGMGPMGGLGPGGPVGGGGPVVHASYTVKGPNGTYETLDAQMGTVEAVSSSSITVKSADGFSQQYAVDSSTTVYADYDGIGSVKTGDDVAIVGLAGTSGVTAERVIDITQVKANGQSWEPAPPMAPTTATPSSGSTTGNFTGFTGDDPGSAA
jgi:hypothetical protein